ncbi:MAG: hypothetical protein KBT34_11740 [Prevotella sp.]|nr:hypothetical protein [Candidatus Prevotella equi]
MRNNIYCFIIILLCSACMAFTSCKKDIVTPESVALETARMYYDMLLKGDYDNFVDATLHGDSISPVYRQQLVLNAKMFIEKQKKEHDGIDSITAVRATADTASHTANSFLSIYFSDKTKEEIVVPMIEKGGIWYIR